MSINSSNANLSGQFFNQQSTMPLIVSHHLQKRTGINWGQQRQLFIPFILKLMSNLKIQPKETIKSWLNRVKLHFTHDQSPLGDEFLKIISNQGNKEFSFMDAIRIRQELISLHNDLFDSFGEVKGISFEEISSLEFIFFPEGFNSNRSCQFCLEEKSLCICSSRTQ